MIRCGKCGKVYDYDRWNGICPKCARYNRPDSRAEMEQDLHEQYDSSPNAHTADYHKEVHRKNQDYYRHERKRDKKSGKKPVAIVSVIILVIVAVSIVMNLRDGSVNSPEEIFVDSSQTNYPQEVGIYVDSSWANYLGTDLADVDWQEYDYVIDGTSDEEMQALSEIQINEGYEFYLVTICISNDSEAILDLRNTDISFWLEEMDEEVYCVKVFNNEYPEVEIDDYGYIDCLVCVPSDAEQLYGNCHFTDEAGDDWSSDFDLDLFKD